MGDTRTFVAEIGTEEIPADALALASKYLKTQVAEGMDAARLPHGEVAVLTTPRRIIVKAGEVAGQSTPLSQEFRGPAVDRAFDADGQPTKAALGFARGKGVEVSDLVRRSEAEGKAEGKAEYLYAVVEQPSRDAAAILSDVMTEAIGSIPWKKSQRWGAGDARFSRPVRWLCALLGDAVVDFAFAGLATGRITYGHRFLAPEAIELASADDLLPRLAQAFVVCDPEERAAEIMRQIHEVEEKTGLRAEVPAGTFAEVVGLVEFPTVLVGRFDEEFLEVPPEIITDAMLSHQRYFPLYDGEALSNSFIVVSNGDRACNEVITEGNERVVRARLYDAAFFYREDLKRPLEDYVPELDSQVFQVELGTMGQKAQRMVALAGKLARDAGFDDAVVARCQRAALLAKADLVTNAVVEFTSQQGVMGGYYARAAGEAEGVAVAIEQHYRPRFAGDAVPDNDEGKIVAIADKLDTIAGLFAIGQPPTGSKDPFALRRNAIGIIAILQGGFPVALARAIDDALAGYEEAGIAIAATVASQIREFFAGRLTVIAKEQGYAAEVVSATLATGTIEPVEVLVRCKALKEAMEGKGAGEKELFADLVTAYKRAANLRDQTLGEAIDEDLLAPEEKTLLAAVDVAQGAVATALASNAYAEALAALAALRGPIDDFFDAVKVMDDDEAIRANHLRVLNRFVSVFADVADFERLK